MNTERAVEYLSKNSLLHMDMLESIRRGNAKLLEVSGQGVMLFNTACGAVMMSAENEAAADKMLAGAPEADLFVAHQDFCIGKVQDRFSFREKLICRQAVYLHRGFLPNARPSVAIRRLEERHLSFLMEHYARADDADYLGERLRAGVMFGAFAGGRLTGFIGSHSEGSIGMLEVLPEYRRRGIASALETFLVNRMLAEGKTPFAQIVVGNEASLELHRKLRFSISDGTLCWLIQ